ncbi:MAG: hypothetical protein AAFR21_00765 [Pseudomonadota bacterium]
MTDDYSDGEFGFDGEKTKGRKIAAPMTASLTAVGASLVAVIAATQVATPSDESEEKASGVCLKTNVRMIDGLEPGCYEPEELDLFAERPVMSERGGEVVVSLSHPTDIMAPVANVRTCAKYNEYKDKDWYALSTREAIRQEFFERSCGALQLLREARAPEWTYFDAGEMSSKDIEELAKGPPFAIVESDAPFAEAEVSLTETGMWRLSAVSQDAIIQEIAHADFDGDGDGEILGFVVIQVQGGTARASHVGVFEKESEDTPCRFRPIGDVISERIVEKTRG